MGRAVVEFRENEGGQRMAQRLMNSTCRFFSWLLDSYSYAKVVYFALFSLNTCWCFYRSAEVGAQDCEGAGTWIETWLRMILWTITWMAG